MFPVTSKQLLDDLHEPMRQWRQHLHQYPETAFEEFQTAQFVADKLREFGLAVHQGLGGTGVVGTLKAGTSAKKIALRAEMDALFIQEHNDFAHKSRHDGKMHACGHDGHTAMLLGAACHLANHPNFNGTVYFIFQPAEEGRAGAKAMIDDGLFAKFPADYVFGMHNFPDIPTGHFAIKSGAMMASFDCFEIIITGLATHAAMPHLGNDAIVAAAQLITALQTIVSRNLNPADAAVVSISQIHAGNTWNAIPDAVTLRGTLRCFKPSLQTEIAGRIQHLTTNICAAFIVTATVVFNPENPGYPVTWNSEAETGLALQAATAVVGADKIDLHPTPSMGSEDFAFMLQEKPGCYLWIGNGPSANSCLLHNPHYDFNDAILPVGAAYWVRLVEMVCG
ncbi:MAG: M20 family metallopeptidase [Methylovulum sp.]|uniref:M20 aminoacylase family protein n=1 Tax=Methylovulum sp. TaxID=1916980 RepID=UPI00261790EF|nr:M20 aminoacylase family protein [Methylovulum sp.]MDD2723789.1 M20 family metallopeptidase [Methylovulum sp.]MDD5123646.1 M20 family metallopeptidase [Methylovulum sp.]